jgi:ribosomal protein S18 acetylase RimI-like enzyme
VVAEITLRPITGDDMEFLYKVYASTRAEELSVTGWSDEEKENFLRMQFHAQHTHYQKHFGDAHFDVILAGDTPIGRLYVHRQPHEIRVADIALLPEHRGHGIGSGLMRELLEEATAAGKPVRLHVEKYNRAKQLYYRMGFRDIDEAGVYDLMEWTAEDPGSEKDKQEED